jgi:hypothetical protein
MSELPQDPSVANTPPGPADEVAEVLASMEDLEGRPVTDHVAVYEQAHERLRRALDPRHG